MNSTTAKRDRLLPDPEPREVKYTIISVDDHVVEPADMFKGRMPKKFELKAPRIIRAPDGSESWVFEDKLLTLNGAVAVAGTRYRETMLEPVGFDEMRKGAWDIHERIRDMDLGGLWASANFPSILTGFSGSIFSQASDRELGLATMRAWNDWMFEEWYSPYPDRIIPIALTWLDDPLLAAEEVRRNAARGVKSLAFPELPHWLGYPSIHTNHWDPVLQACEETGTVVCLHVGSAGLRSLGPGAKRGLSALVFPLSSYESCAEWVWSGVLLRFPELKIVMSEGGIGWVPMLLDRLDFMIDHAGGPSSGAEGWGSRDIRPSEVMRRNFYFALLDDPTSLRALDKIGVDHVMVECDYPHPDTTWPDTQSHFVNLFKDLPVEHIRKMTHENAAKLFGHPLPPKVLP
jgi:predicted TIM-barrel fold metal-dependent hydrolase